MSIPPNSPWRGCASKFSQPVDEEDECAAQSLVEKVYSYNCSNSTSAPLAEIVYRSSSKEHDILHHVFRWDLSRYEQVFQNGLQAKPQENTPDNIYYNLDHYVNHGGSPLISKLTPNNYVFISTTIDGGRHPSLTQDGEHEMEVYRYEIYAPGGIWVAATLGDKFSYPAKDEVAFVAGIAPQYIRSAQRFRLIFHDSSTRIERVNSDIIINESFNPQQCLLSLLNIQMPVCDYLDENRKKVPLNTVFYDPGLVVGRPVTDPDTTDWYATKVSKIESYINAAFRSSLKNEAYLFMKNQYVLLNYAPGTTDDKVVFGPVLIFEGYPSLTSTPFSDYGIDCAFGCHDESRAFIFSGNLCAYIDYSPHTPNDKIIKGPITISSMFPFFKGTVFESGVDAAFEATARCEAYLFKDDQYALIKYGSGSYLIAIRPISKGFASLANTIFGDGIEAAFASHRTDEAYLFKGDSYALINFAPGTTDDYVIGGVKKILPNWPSLRSILPRKNDAVDVVDHTIP